MSTLIEGEDVMRGEQRRSDEVPPAGVRGAAVNKQEGRATGAPVVNAIEHDAVGAQESPCLHRHPPFQYVEPREAIASSGSCFARKKIRATILQVN
jgi:hypothetical protein